MRRAVNVDSQANSHRGPQFNKRGRRNDRGDDHNGDEPEQPPEDPLANATTLYVGNLSFYTTEEQVYELFSKCGEIKRLVMGLDRFNKTPCGFCFVEYYTHQDALDCMKYIGGTKLDERIIRTDLDPGFEEGRQYGRGKSGGQVRVSGAGPPSPILFADHIFTGKRRVQRRVRRRQRRSGQGSAGTRTQPGERRLQPPCLVDRMTERSIETTSSDKRIPWCCQESGTSGRSHRPSMATKKHTKYASAHRRFTNRRKGSNSLCRKMGSQAGT